MRCPFKCGEGRQQTLPPFSCQSIPKRLQGLLVGLDHLLDHLAADTAGLAAGQVAVVALLQVDTDLPWCSRSSLKRGSVRREAADRGVSQFTDKIIENAHVLAKWLCAVCCLYSLFCQMLFTDFDALNEGEKHLAVKLLYLREAAGQIEEVRIIFLCLS